MGIDCNMWDWVSIDYNGSKGLFQMLDFDCKGVNVEMTEKEANLNSWDDFTGDIFLKADDVKSEMDFYVVVDIETVTTKDGSIRLRTYLERDKKKYAFDLNKTNSKKLLGLGILTPRALIGKKLYFKKVLVRNPQTNIEQDGLRVHSVE